MDDMTKALKDAGNIVDGNEDVEKVTITIVLKRPKSDKASDKASDKTKEAKESE